MRNPKVGLLAPLALISAAVLAASGGLASANGSSSGGEIQWYEADTALAGNLGTDILTGAITDHGADHQGVAGGGNYNRFVLSKGTFEISIRKFGKRLNFPVNPATCSADGTASAPIPIVPGSGTGAYHGISGTIQTTVTFAWILPRLRQRPLQHERDPLPGHRDRTRRRSRLRQIANTRDPSHVYRPVAGLQPPATALAEPSARIGTRNGEQHVQASTQHGLAEAHHPRHAASRRRSGGLLVVSHKGTGLQEALHGFRQFAFPRASLRIADCHLGTGRPSDACCDMCGRVRCGVYSRSSGSCPRSDLVDPVHPRPRRRRRDRPDGSIVHDAHGLHCGGGLHQRFG